MGKKDLLYTEDHEWVKVDGDMATIGITDYAASELGDVVFVELPVVDDEVEKDDVMAAVESVKAASDIYAPVSGVIVEVNEELEDSPELLNENAYENWIAKIKLSDPQELDELLDYQEYESLISED